MPKKSRKTKVKKHLRRTKKKKRTVVRQHKRRVKKKKKNFGALEIISDKDELLIDDPLAIQEKHLKDLERELGIDIILKDQGREIQLRPRIKKRRPRRIRTRPKIKRPMGRRLSGIDFQGPGQVKTEEIFTGFKPTTFVKVPKKRGPKPKKKTLPQIKQETIVDDYPVMGERNIVIVGKEKFNKILRSIGLKE